MIIIKPSFFFDLDGTITAQELLPLIAEAAGLIDQIQTLTDLTISGKIPFVESFQHRVNILKSVPVSTVREVVEGARLHPHIVSFIKDNSERCFVVTGNLDVWISGLCERLGCRYFTSKARIDSNNEVAGVEYVLEKFHIANSFSSPFIAIGEGHNDAEMIRNAQVGIAFGGVHMPASSVLECASHCVFEEESLCRLLKRLL